MAQEAKIGDKVRVVSGPHEGRGGILTQMREIQAGYTDPEWYGVIAFEQEDHEGKKFTDHVSVPLRRVAPTQ